MTRSPKNSSDGSTRDPSTARRTSSGDDTATSAASCLGESTRTTTCRSKKPPVMITCARCKVELAKSDSCSVQAGRNYSRVCQDCIRVMMGFAPRKL